MTEDKLGVGSAVKIAQQIRAAIAQELNLTASAGISYNKFLAKIASDQNKPNGQCILLRGEGEGFVGALKFLSMLFFMVLPISRKISH